jgi:hypothetical protein
MSKTRSRSGQGRANREVAYKKIGSSLLKLCEPRLERAPTNMDSGDGTLKELPGCAHPAELLVLVGPRSTNPSVARDRWSIAVAG